jgi:signal peptidase II
MGNARMSLKETFLKRYFYEYLFLLSVAGVIIALDQWTKWLVRTQLAFNQEWAPWKWLLPYARVIHIQNTGAAFGSFQNFGDVFMVLAIIVSLGILIMFPRVANNDWLLRVVMSMELGGACGNLVDRFTQRYVTDFLSVGNFAVFNVADASISVGVAILIGGMLIRDWQQKQKSVQSPALETTLEPPAQPQEPQQENHSSE